MSYNTAKLSEAFGGPVSLGRELRYSGDLKDILLGGLPRAAFDALANTLARSPSEQRELREAIFETKSRQTGRTHDKLRLIEGERGPNCPDLSTRGVGFWR